VGIDRAFRARVGVAASRAHLENEPTRRPNLGVHVAVSRRVTGAAVLLGLPTRSILLQLTPEMQPVMPRSVAASRFWRLPFRQA